MDSSSERCSTQRIVFTRPFSLGDSAEVYPAGTYEVDSTDWNFEGHLHTAHVRRSTVLIIPTASGTCHREILLEDLDEALRRDCERPERKG